MKNHEPGRIYMKGGAGNYEGFFKGMKLKGTGTNELEKELNSL